MYEVIALTVSQLFPPGTDPAGIVKRHVWRNAKYVGIVNGEVQVWYGVSANLRVLEQGYRTIYMDYIYNALPAETRERLFGITFSQAISTLDPFIFLYVTSCPVRFSQYVREKGFVFRQINDVIHPGCVIDILDFLDTSTNAWSQTALKLLKLQQYLLLSAPSSLT